MVEKYRFEKKNCAISVFSSNVSDKISTTVDLRVSTYLDTLEKGTHVQALVLVTRERSKD